MKSLKRMRDLLTNDPNNPDRTLMLTPQVRVCVRPWAHVCGRGRPRFRMPLSFRLRAWRHRKVSGDMGVRNTGNTCRVDNAAAVIRLNTHRVPMLTCNATPLAAVSVHFRLWHCAARSWRSSFLRQLPLVLRAAMLRLDPTATVGCVCVC